MTIRSERIFKYHYLWEQMDNFSILGTTFDALSEVFNLITHLNDFLSSGMKRYRMSDGYAELWLRYLQNHRCWIRNSYHT